MKLSVGYYVGLLSVCYSTHAFAPVARQNRMLVQPLAMSSAANGDDGPVLNKWSR